MALMQLATVEEALHGLIVKPLTFFGFGHISFYDRQVCSVLGHA